jgi:hypothetical protein
MREFFKTYLFLRQILRKSRLQAFAAAWEVEKTRRKVRKYPPAATGGL